MRTLLLLAAIGAALIVTPAQAATQTGTGSSRISLEGRGLKSFRALGVKLSAAKPVRVSRTALVLPVATGELATRVRLDSKGSLTLRRGKRRITFRSLQVALGTRGSISGLVGKRRVTLFSVVPAKRKAMRVNAVTGRATLQSARVGLARAGAAAVRRALRLRRTPSGSFGTVTVIATVRRPGGPGGAGGGSGGGGVPVAGPIPGDEPPELARPASAVDVTAGGIVWNVRESFIDYVNTQAAPNGGSYPSAGATAINDGRPLIYKFGYQPVRGWWDAASGTAALYYAGTVNFRYYAHGIDFDARNPEIEINGSASRAIYRLDGRRSTPYGNKRGVLLDLAAGTTATRCSTAGQVVTCNAIPARVPQDASQSVFAGFYQPGDPFGDISVSFTTP